MGSSHYRIVKKPDRVGPDIFVKLNKYLINTMEYPNNSTCKNILHFAH